MNRRVFSNPKQKKGRRSDYKNLAQSQKQSWFGGFLKNFQKKDQQTTLPRYVHKKLYNQNIKQKPQIKLVKQILLTHLKTSQDKLVCKNTGVVKFFLIVFRCPLC
ncbi:MAG: hypothetical protein HC932_02175 [Thermales bacterium]|nr:hypothetical protein [Thermales bacterium]